MRRNVITGGSLKGLPGSTLAGGPVLRRLGSKGGANEQDDAAAYYGFAFRFPPRLVSVALAGFMKSMPRPVIA